MPANLDDKLVVALSSRALFDFEEENAVFDANDPRSYQKLQLSRLNQPAGKGAAFKLVKKLLAFNTPTAHKVEVVLDEQNTQPVALGQLCQHAPDRRSLVACEPRGRLIEKQHGRLLGEYHSELQRLLCAMRQMARPLVEHGGQSRDFHRVKRWSG